jgi:integrase
MRPAFAYLTGWRMGEILPLRWDAVDRAAGEIRLRTSKNGHGRVIPLEGDLAALIEHRWQAREWKHKDEVTHFSPLAFHRKGKPLGDFRKAWTNACTAANCSGRLCHDLRRTAVRNMAYQTVCARHLEGIVAKWKAAPYRPDVTLSSWLKIKNRNYSQARDRAELFQR